MSRIAGGRRAREGCEGVDAAVLAGHHHGAERRVHLRVEGAMHPPPVAGRLGGAVRVPDRAAPARPHGGEILGRVLADERGVADIRRDRVDLQAMLVVDARDLVSDRPVRPEHGRIQGGDAACRGRRPRASTVVTTDPHDAGAPELGERRDAEDARHRHRATPEPLQEPVLGRRRHHAIGHRRRRGSRASGIRARRLARRPGSRFSEVSRTSPTASRSDSSGGRICTVMPRARTRRVARHTSGSRPRSVRPRPRGPRPRRFASEVSHARTSPNSCTRFSRSPVRRALASSPTSSVSQRNVASRPRAASRSRYVSRIVACSSPSSMGGEYRQAPARSRRRRRSSGAPSWAPLRYMSPSGMGYRFAT